MRAIWEGVSAGNMVAASVGLIGRIGNRESAMVSPFRLSTTCVSRTRLAGNHTLEPQAIPVSGWSDVYPTARARIAAPRAECLPIFRRLWQLEEGSCLREPAKR